MGVRINEVGNRYGRLTVVSFSNCDKYKNAQWNCVCDCGAQTIVGGCDLRRKQTISCGCFHREMVADMARKRAKHGHATERTPTYRIWQAMIGRCQHETNGMYPAYGGRGITVCDGWQDFKNFLEDMGLRPAGMSIDRRNNNEGYSKDNCRWATTKEQNNNKRTNVRVTFNGETLTLAQWADRIGIEDQTINKRIFTYGWSVEKALTTPLK